MEDASPWLKRRGDISSQAPISLQDVRNIHTHAFDRKYESNDSFVEVGDDELSLAEHHPIHNEPITAAPWYISNPTKSPDGSLCQFCSHASFACILNHKVSRRDGPVFLLQDMLANLSTCSFCRLAVTALCRTNNLAGTEELQPVDGIVYCSVHSHGPYLKITRHSLSKKYREIGKPALIQEINSQSSACFGRQMPVSVADLVLIKRWIEGCEHDHKDQSALVGEGVGADMSNYEPSSARYGTENTLHVIDLWNECITCVTSNTRYVVLSYVWGAAKQLRLLQSNYNYLLHKGSLRMGNYGADIPRTIRDAMQLTARLGVRYLWVDALCLIQDAPGFKEELYRMDRIYSDAAWCLVAGSAKDANSPLPRMGHNDKEKVRYQHVETIRGQTLAVLLPSLAEYLQSTHWNTRAWTYQESVLPARLLIVGEPQMYFTCHHGFAFYEDRAFEFSHEQASFRPEGHIYGIEHESNFEMYANAVSAYTSRQLSFSEDVIKAFAGILSKLKAAFRDEFLFGLPRTELDQALLWYPTRDHQRRKDRNSSMHKALFPSWSWAGWVGRVHFPTRLALSRVRWKDSYSEEYFLSDDVRAPRITVPNVPWYQDTWDMFKVGRKDGYAVPMFYEKHKVNNLYLHPIAEAWQRRNDIIYYGSRQLHFHALACHFYINGEHCDARLSIHPCDSVHHLCALEIANSAKRLVGTVHVPGSISRALGIGKFEFIRLSRTRLIIDSSRGVPQCRDEYTEGAKISHFPGPETHSVPPVEQPDVELNQGDGFECDTTAFDIDKPWCVYNVMLVQTTDGVSHRIGLGKIHIDAFLQESPVWRDVRLE